MADILRYVPGVGMAQGEGHRDAPVMRGNARNLFGIDDGLLMTHAVDDRGYQCGGIAAGSVLACTASMIESLE